VEALLADKVFKLLFPAVEAYPRRVFPLRVMLRVYDPGTPLTLLGLPEAEGGLARNGRVKVVLAV
jgi:hypothetical protein